jgi:16S rRNA (guanine527-N7)-methyltransferase
MIDMEKDSGSVAERLNTMLVGACLNPLDGETAGRFAAYHALLMKWNERMNLTAVRDDDGILGRHFVESIACARALPAGIETLLDFGSGAGFPGVPIALCRPEIAVTLGESQGKKAAFLQEAVRVLELRSRVFGERAERLKDRFDCVTLRAVDRMERATEAAAGLVGKGGWLALMSTRVELGGLQRAAGTSFRWLEPLLLSGSDGRVISLGERLSGQF